ncbi:sugar transferase [Agromyces sp. LHK192]|uniref:sugar transferase n=1 Tax=Agromyces sp. LHK192 TaxID=2498704 RepID=UPI0013E317B2|nr:sugar transferase [Agromyces sp. LHK192]
MGRTRDDLRTSVVYQPRTLAWPRKLAWALVATDALVVISSLLIAQVVRFGVDPGGLAAAGLDLGYLVAGAGIGGLWLAALSALRSREQRIIGVGVTEYQRVANATLITFGAVAILAYLSGVDLARGYLGVALPVGLVLLLVGRMLWRHSLQRLRRAGRALTGAIVVGPRAEVERTVAGLQRNLKSGYRPIGVVLTDDDRAPTVADLPRIARGRLVDIVRRTRTRAVMIAGELPGGRGEIRDLGWDLENSKVELILVSRLTDVAGPRIHFRRLEGLPMVHVDLPQYSGFSHSVKRVFDVIVAGIALVVLAPVFAVVALAIRLDSEGPVLFRQERVGAHGARFTMLKFRSMVVDAEARLALVAADGDDGNGVLFKLRDDPRVTRVGGVLRKYSLDELPQLWNVFLGHMSLVGPRPPLPAEVEQYERRVGRRLLIKPGITGLWQVSGRSDLSWEESVKLDLYYVENWSVTSDLLILLRTVRAVVGRDGAY